VVQLTNQCLLQAGAWQISRLRRQPLLEFYPWKPPESIPEGTSERKRVNRDPLALAHFYQSLLDSQVVTTRAELARYLNVSRARVILIPGNRTKVLNLLAAHLVWFKHLPAPDAAQLLTDWAMNPRHASKDIAADLANGTDKVAKQISRMCGWYEDQKTSSPTAQFDDHREFAVTELNALRPSMATLPPDERVNQAHFLLHFLRFPHDAEGSDRSHNDLPLLLLQPPEPPGRES
jgi:hypothetical protein